MRILYVEDQAETARALGSLLKRNGHEVTVAQTAHDASAACVDHEFDLWILDVELPDAHGGNLLRALRKLSDTRAIALTGHGTPQEIAEGEDDGFDAYLVKPVDLEQLFETMERLYQST